MVEFIVITGGLVGGLVVLSSDVNDEGDRTAKPTDEDASSGAGPQCIGNNPEEKNGRTNTDLPGGRKAAEKLFDELTGGESTRDPETGGLKGANDVRIRTGDDGRVRVDVPADVGPSGKHETIHFND